MLSKWGRSPAFLLPRPERDLGPLSNPEASTTDSNKTHDVETIFCFLTRGLSWGHRNSQDFQIPEGITAGDQVLEGETAESAGPQVTRGIQTGHKKTEKWMEPLHIHPIKPLRDSWRNVI